MTTETVTGFYAEDLRVPIDEQGDGRTILLLNGGGGPPTMGTLPSAVAEHLRVIAPVHPDIAGTPRPEWFDGIDDIALSYLQLLGRRELRDGLVIGSSIGGWIASEMAVREHELISGTALLDAVGLNVDVIEQAYHGVRRIKTAVDRDDFVLSNHPVSPVSVPQLPSLC